MTLNKDIATIWLVCLNYMYKSIVIQVRSGRYLFLLWPSIRHFDISTTFYLLTIINSSHMSIRYIQMNWKSKIPQSLLHLLRI
jgi:hypothetical protein